MMKSASRETTTINDTTPSRIAGFDLQRFLPFKVRMLYRAVSDSVLNIYGPALGIGAPEWRTMVILGPHRTMSASEIVDQSSMTKVVVSRAIKSLQSHGFIRRDIDGGDKRKAALRLTIEGQDALAQVLPKVMQLEDDLLDGIADEDLRVFYKVAAQLRANAERSVHCSEGSSQSL